MKAALFFILFMMGFSAQANEPGQPLLAQLGNIIKQYAAQANAGAQIERVYMLEQNSRTIDTVSVYEFVPNGDPHALCVMVVSNTGVSNSCYKRNTGN